jgi:hypothetical protein
MNNPAFKNLLTSAKIFTHSSAGEYSFICTSATQGSGESAGMLEIEGIGLVPDLSGEDFQFEFNGKSYNAGLEIVSRVGAGCKVCLGTIVRDPLFWE